MRGTSSKEKQNPKDLSAKISTTPLQLSRADFRAHLTSLPLACYTSQGDLFPIASTNATAASEESEKLKTQLVEGLQRLLRVLNKIEPRSVLLTTYLNLGTPYGKIFGALTRQYSCNCYQHALQAALNTVFDNTTALGDWLCCTIASMLSMDKDWELDTDYLYNRHIVDSEGS